MQARTLIRTVMLLLPLALLGAQSAAAQLPETDPSERLRSLLPADVAERVLARIADARARALPPEAVVALENRALKFASRGVDPAALERAIGEHAERMQRASQAIEQGRGQRPLGEEIDAGAEAMRQGVDGAAVRDLARSAPSGRSLAVPLFVIGSLVERGLPADQALQRVSERLTARASDRDIERLAGEPGRGRPDGPGPGLRGGDRPGSTGRPIHVPLIGGEPTIPTRAPVGPPAGPRRP